MEEDILYENEQNITKPPKTPLIGIIITIIGIIILITSFLPQNTGNKSKIDAEVTYASVLKESSTNPEEMVQNIKVSYTINKKTYETGINNIINGKYSKYDIIKIYVSEDNPMEVSLGKQSNNKLLISIVIIFIGIITFIGLLDPVIAFVKVFLFPTPTSEDEKTEQKKLNFIEIITDATSGVTNTIEKIFKKQNK